MEILSMRGAASAIWAVSEGVANRARTTDRLFALAKVLGGHVTSTNEVTGLCDGVPLAYRFVTRGAGSKSEQWTEVRAAIPDAYPLAIYMRLQGWLVLGKIVRGELIGGGGGGAAGGARGL